jgi:hypothetical protein
LDKPLEELHRQKAAEEKHQLKCLHEMIIYIRIMDIITDFTKKETMLPNFGTRN